MATSQKNNDNKRLARLLGVNIAYRRNLLGITQEALAERVGVGAVSLSRMEKGVIAPKFERLQVFADVLGCSVADLFRLPDASNRADENAAIIAQIIKPLSQDGQTALTKIMADMVKVRKARA